jgi:hypothetical protein
MELAEQPHRAAAAADPPPTCGLRPGATAEGDRCGGVEEREQAATCPICQDEDGGGAFVALPECGHAMHIQCCIEYSLYMGAQQQAPPPPGASQAAGGGRDLQLLCPVCRRSVGRARRPAAGRQQSLLLPRSRAAPAPGPPAAPQRGWDVIGDVQDLLLLLPGGEGGGAEWRRAGRGGGGRRQQPPRSDDLEWQGLVYGADAAPSSLAGAGGGSILVRAERDFRCVRAVLQVLASVWLLLAAYFVVMVLLGGGGSSGVAWPSPSPLGRQAPL